MRVLIQRVQKASVTINGSDKRSIGIGLVVFLGITHDDTPADVRYLVDKISDLRIFRDESDKINLSLRDIGGHCLLVSQFTLYADTRKGRRPSFVDAARPETALPLYNLAVSALKSIAGLNVQTGEFGADMLVEIANDGPVTFMIESK